MIRQAQEHFVKVLVESIANEVLRDIREARVPETWEGIELRQLLADRFTRAVIKGIMTPARKREYNNEVMVRDL